MALSRTEKKILQHIKSNADDGVLVGPVQDLADDLNMDFGVVYRAIKKIESEGYIRTTNRSRMGLEIEVTNLDYEHQFSASNLQERTKENNSSLTELFVEISLLEKDDLKKIIEFAEMLLNKK